MKPAIEVSHLTKEYRLGALRGLRQVATDAGHRLLGRTAPPRQRFLALDDVSFSVQPGEVVGVIGHNGAGKSTLLKMISRITTPTSGSVTVNGRIAPLIEVGAGFVGDMTGRENVYLNGAILGLKKREIDRKFDEIVAFAEMEQFIDTPVKRYSSGMQVKLAFAVATSIESEILIVDEVLAVGDLAFQRKCFDRMEDLIKREQRTVLLVSHQIRQVERLCSRVILMDHGHVAAVGPPRDTCNLFYAQNDKKIAQAAQKEIKGSRRVAESGEIELVEAILLNHEEEVCDALTHARDCTIRMIYAVHKEMRDVSFGVGIHTTDFIYLADRDTEDDRIQIPLIQPGTLVVHCRIKNLPFLPGTYSFRIGVAADGGYRLAYLAENISPFHVKADFENRLQGFVRLETAWEMERGNKSAVVLTGQTDAKRDSAFS